MPIPAPVRSSPLLCPRILLLAIVLIGLAIRVVASTGSPWLDELWSWRMAMAGDVLAAHDNNHFLNTIWLWLVGDYRAPLIWRLPAILSGGVTIVLAWMILKRLGRLHALVGAMLVAIAYPLVVYQSEARGYGLMLACLLGCVEIQLRLLESRARDKSVRALRLGMAICAGVGVISHLSLVIAYPLVIVAAVVVRPVGRAVVSVIWDHVLAMALILTWFFAFAWHMSIGGGPELDVATVLTEAASTMTGAEGTIAVIMLPLLVLVSMLLTRRREPRVIGMLGVMAVVYPLLVLLAKDRLLYVRYFLPAMLPATLLIGAGIGEALRRPRLRVAMGVLTIALVSLHAMRDFELITVGRDRHDIALRDIATQHPSLTTIGSDADFQLRTITMYHDGDYQPVGATVVVPGESRPDWFVVMHETADAQRVVGSVRYDRHGLYRAPGLSGITWTVYRRHDISAKIDSAHARIE